jgi:hypothetical protein
VTKINAAGSALVYSTYLGGSGDEYGHGSGGIAVDADDLIYRVGSTLHTSDPSSVRMASLGSPPGAFFLVTALNKGGRTKFFYRGSIPLPWASATLTSLPLAILTLRPKHACLLPETHFISCAESHKLWKFPKNFWGPVFKKSRGRVLKTREV